MLKGGMIRINFKISEKINRKKIKKITTTRKLKNTNGKTKGITVGNKIIKTKQKKNNDVMILPKGFPME